MNVCLSLALVYASLKMYFYLPCIGPNQRVTMANKVGSELSGVYISISLDSLVSVTEVTKDDKVTLKNVGYLGHRQRMRPPCVSCPHGYNSLWTNVTNQLIVPDVNALKIVKEDGTYDKTVTLTNCDPYSMHPLLHDHSILWVLCNPVGNQAQVYRVSLMNLTTEDPFTVRSNLEPFLSQVGEIFEQGGTVHVILATANGLVYASQDTPEAAPIHLSETCLSVLRITEFNDYNGGNFLIECGNSTSQTVVNTYLCDYAFECSDVHLRSGRTLGKIITSDDVSILASVAPNGIDILERNQGRVIRVLPSSNHKFHDAYIESVAGSHLMVYSDKGGKVHLYDISTALNGEDVSSQTIEGDYVTCRDCSGLVRIREGYFATATDLGVAWFSIAPPKLLRTSVGIKADRLAYSFSQLPSHDVNLSRTVIIIIIVGVVIGSVVAVGIISLLLVIVILCWKKKSK